MPLCWACIAFPGVVVFFSRRAGALSRHAVCRQPLLPLRVVDAELPIGTMRLG